MDSKKKVREPRWILSILDADSCCFHHSVHRLEFFRYSLGRMEITRLARGQKGAFYTILTVGRAGI